MSDGLGHLAITRIQRIRFGGQEKQKSNKLYFSNLYPQAKAYFRETYKSQNINPVSLTPEFI